MRSGRRFESPSGLVVERVEVIRAAPELLLVRVSGHCRQRDGELEGLELLVGEGVAAKTVAPLPGSGEPSAGRDPGAPVAWRAAFPVRASGDTPLRCALRARAQIVVPLDLVDGNALVSDDDEHADRGAGPVAWRRFASRVRSRIVASVSAAETGAAPTVLVIAPPPPPTRPSVPPPSSTTLAELEAELVKSKRRAAALEARSQSLEAAAHASGQAASERVDDLLAATAEALNRVSWAEEARFAAEERLERYESTERP